MSAAVAVTRGELTPAQLRSAACASEEPAQVRRLLAIALVLEGMPRQQAAEQCGMDRQTLRDWVHRYNEGGVAGLRSRPCPGRAPLLTPEQKAELRALVVAGPDPARDKVVRWRCVDLRAAVGRFHVTDLHVQMRRLPKPIVAMVAGYAVGGGQILHLVCDLSIAADNARFGQTGPRVGSFDGGFGAALLARTVGLRKAKEIWFLCRQYDAQEALAMGLVNTVVPLDTLEEETVSWCREMLALSPFSLRLLKASFHAAEDGLAGIQQLAHDANLLFYATEEAAEGREAFKAKRAPDFSKFPRRP